MKLNFVAAMHSNLRNLESVCNCLSQLRKAKQLFELYNYIFAMLSFYD